MSTTDCGIATTIGAPFSGTPRCDRGRQFRAMAATWWWLRRPGQLYSGPSWGISFRVADIEEAETQGLLPDRSCEGAMSITRET